MIDLPARAARLGHLHDRSADPEHVADVNVAFVPADGGKILAETARNQVRSQRWKFRDELRIVLRGVVMQRLLGTTVVAQVRLVIPFDSRRSNAAGRDGPLEDSRSMSLE